MLLRLCADLPAACTCLFLAQIADAAAAPRPLMHVLAALDGQTRLPRAAWTAARLAPLAAQFGARCGGDSRLCGAGRGEGEVGYVVQSATSSACLQAC